LSGRLGDYGEHGSYLPGIARRPCLSDSGRS
jgi:hypothetical protein